MRKELLSKALVMGVILLFIGVSVSTSTGKIDTVKTIMNDGSLLGYVNDTSGNPIEGALVKVHFHETYKEDYSDEDGYYHVTNIPICYCLKNVTCSKEGYKTEWVLIGIAENTTHDFILTSYNHPPEEPLIRGKCIIKELGTYDYKFKAIDPDGDNIRYQIYWGDSPEKEWTDYYPSGEEIIVSHTWEKFGDVMILARANDTHGALGPWGELEWKSKSTEDTNENEPDKHNVDYDYAIIGGYCQYMTGKGIFLWRDARFNSGGQHSLFLNIEFYRFPDILVHWVDGLTDIIADYFIPSLLWMWFYSFGEVKGIAFGNIEWS